MQLDGFLLKPVTKSMIVDTLVNVFAEHAGATRRGPTRGTTRGFTARGSCSPRTTRSTSRLPPSCS